MSALDIRISAISDVALVVVKRLIDENEATQKIQDEQSGPVALANALSEFFQITGSLEDHDQAIASDQLSELADYGLDLLDRLAAQVLHLDIHDQRDNLAVVFTSVAVWFARRGAQLDNLQAVSDNFALLVNAQQDAEQLAQLSQHMDQVLEAASERLKADEDRSDLYRPWRLMNLNAGVAAARSLNPEQMGAVFANMGRRVPYEMPGFMADGKRNMLNPNVPQEVQDVITQYAAKWPDLLAH